ncbi:hypothetical protein P0W64_11195 [Tsukamurella sp. 8F]|uniref:hypothetical protein n=1 Tax=unclassified Tsukamurella TaxID=2633480 RepID=UPI0023BA3197|nr:MULTISPECIES: hypothetical protein [unclassified Tsukamurella]MDF0528962.1 hypothetical protein [Tsukamurella sp. 8J]MDF0587335.1 hypothetical protein [Tsukamurella sp. 8F]
MDDRTIVEALLQMHGLTPPSAEVDLLVAAYAPSRARVERLYAMPGVRYAEPAVTFDPRP